MEIKYRISLGYILFILGLLAIVVLGAHGFIDDSFKQTEGAKMYTSLAFVFGFAYFLVVPKGRKLKVDTSKIVLPNVLLPPFKSKVIKIKDIQRLDERYTRNGDIILTIYTKGDKYKIHSGLCSQKNFEFKFVPDEYHSLFRFIESQRNKRVHKD